ncbi:MAG: dNTP triphosphohydrolase [Verrucomicrobiales bacterium]|nr:dNTP triphosphohydrolase [Verrucomicrobiales bacterium]
MRNQFYGAFDCERIEGDKPLRKGEHRSPFQIDRDRIIHTSAFRRLQNKTQVFFSGEYDFYRTRLTHSIEVAQIGRSLCDRLNRTSPLLGPEFFLDADLVEAVCLSHDIGHPPFGHTGERTLHRLMQPYGGFEGNAQTLRILSTILFGPDRGMNPTRALMDGVLKYKTLFGEVADQKNHFLYADQQPLLDFVMAGRGFPETLAPGKTRNGFRSIECRLMDWADDTAYSLNDIADGIQAGFIQVDRIERWAAGQTLTDAQSSLITELLEAIRRGRVESTVGKKIGRFIGAVELEEITGPEAPLADLTARHRHRLVIDPAVEEECALYKRLALDLVFRSQQLQQLDRKSDYILTRLFGVFAELYIVPGQPGRGHYHLLSEEEENLIFSQPDEASRARVVCDVLAKMTDGIASRTYRRLFDADFGSIVDLV